MLQCVGYMCRLDYVSMLCNEHVFVVGVEQIFVIVVSTMESKLRSSMLEITRCLNHLLAVACHAGDSGAMLAVLWLFEDRELLYMISSVCSGARLHSYMFIPGGLRTTITSAVLLDIVTYKFGLVGRSELLLVIAVQHRLWLYRLANVGVLGSSCSGVVSGVLLRSSGVA